MHTTYSIGWLVLALVCSTARAASAQSDWAVVEALPPNTRLLIVIPGETVDGRLRSVDATSLRLDTRTLPKDDVRRVERVRTRKKQGAVRGALIGLGVGLAQGYASADINKAQWAATLGARWATLGAVTGTVWGANAERAEIIYRR